MILNEQPKYFQDQIAAAGIAFFAVIIITPFLLLLRQAHRRVSFLTDTLRDIQKLLQENEAETMQEHLKWAGENIPETPRTRIAELEEHKAHRIMPLSQENLGHPPDPNTNVEEKLEQVSVRLISLEDQRYSLLYRLSISPASPRYRQIRNEELRAIWIIDDHIHHMLEQLMYLRIAEAPHFLLREARRACASQLSLATHLTVCLEVETAKLKIELESDVKRQDEEDWISWERREQAPSLEETESRSPQSRRLEESEKARATQNEFQEHAREVSDLRFQLAAMKRANEVAEKNEVELARIGNTHAHARSTEEQKKIFELDHRFQHQHEGLVREDMRNTETRIMEQVRKMFEGSERSMKPSEETAALLRYVEGYERSRHGTAEPQHQAAINRESYEKAFRVHRTKHVRLHAPDDERREQSSPFGMQPGNLIRMHSGQVKGMNNSGRTQWPSQLGDLRLCDGEGVARVDLDDFMLANHFSSSGTTLVDSGSDEERDGVVNEGL